MGDVTVTAHSPSEVLQNLIVESMESVGLKLRIRTICGICIEMEFHDVASLEETRQAWLESQK